MTALTQSTGEKAQWYRFDLTLNKERFDVTAEYLGPVEIGPRVFVGLRYPYKGPGKAKSHVVTKWWPAECFGPFQKAQAPAEGTESTFLRKGRSDDQDESEGTGAVVDAQARVTPAAKPAAKPDDDGLDDEPPVKAKAPTKVPVIEDDDDPAAKAPAKPAPVKPKPAPVEDDGFDDEPPVKPAAKPAVKKPAAQDDLDDDLDVPAKPASKPVAAKSATKKPPAEDPDDFDDAFDSDD